MNLSQTQIADLARSSALRTVQSNIGNFGNCPSCVLPFLSGLGCDCEKTGVAKCDSCRSHMGEWTRGFGDVSGSLWDMIKPVFPWILLTGVVAGFAGWKLGNVYCTAKNKVSGAFSVKRKRK
jgi:hypothetical protein